MTGGAAHGTDVPGEWVEAAAFAMYGGLRETWEREPEEGREDYRIQARSVWPLVAAERDRAVRDALDEVVRRIEYHIGHHEWDDCGECKAYRSAAAEVRIVTELRDGGAR